MRKNSLLPGWSLMLAEGSLEIPALISAYILDLPEMADKYVQIACKSAEKYKQIAKEYANYPEDQDYADWCKYFQDISADLLKEAGDTEHLVSMFQRISRIANELKRCSKEANATTENAESDTPAPDTEAASAEAEAPENNSEAEGEKSEESNTVAEDNSSSTAENAVCFGNSFNKIEECKKDPEKLNAVIEECKKMSVLFQKFAEVESAWAIYYSNWYKSSCDPSWRHNQLKYELMHDHHEEMAKYFDELSGKINPEADKTNDENADADASGENTTPAEGDHSTENANAEA